MVLINSPLPGCFVFRPASLVDSRGTFVKTLDRSLLEVVGGNFDIKEEFFSVSKCNVIRGMHFQLPPNDHDKIVYCIKGAVCDVLLDLRAGEHYGKVATVHLSEENCDVLVIAKGVAHGFAACVDDTLMVYKTNSEYNPDFDSGILWDSFGHDWGITNPIISVRDRCHIPFSEFSSPFK